MCEDTFELIACLSSLIMFPAMLSCLSLEMKFQNAFGLCVCYCSCWELIQLGQSNRTKVFVHVFPDVTKLLLVFWISRSFCFLI